MSGYSIEREGILFVLSAPSGAGKTTAAALLLERLPDLSMSVSHTTRKPREGEADGRDYHFVDDKTFDGMIERGEFLEWAKVHTARYGTSKTMIKEELARRRDLLLDIDTQGADALRGTGLNVAPIFLLPPSMAELERRLSGRGGESAEALRVRLENARAEIKRAPDYDYNVVNDVLERAVDELAAIIAAERLKTKNRKVTLKDL
ncbi:MAG: guanylate kinase [Candidatus Nitrospinota bacterium M3_3B_026]